MVGLQVCHPQYIYLSKKGHKVDLFEKSDSLGGQLKVAKVPPHKSEIGRVIEYLKNDLRKYHVNVHLNRNISVQDLKNMPYDKIVIATGSVPADLAIKSDIKPYQAIEILTGKIPAGKKIAIIGGGLTGLETAAYLAMQGKDVTVFEVKDEVGEGIFSMVRKLLLKNLNKLNVNIVTKAIIKEISNGKLICSIKDGANKVFNVDDVVLATGVVPDKTFTELQGDDRYCFVGDCKEIATAVEAIRDGAEISLKI
ncbi:Pyridine nucleotide-disulphide oxidoreductase [Caldanaerobius fijiensis DSM 17918]|uniref:Pyridine nucleotide-disulphide oxidoreductase n=1 Tax=Caldanaerobius fijiensis DSM 17918 TaxID=1121256 RepID=A0A1M5CGS3_9THEO|nr:Pyridine nucleotide-disulphide oxidoreductase [Caldanaerobius fijiensis DSM 17918]